MKHKTPSFNAGKKAWAQKVPSFSFSLSELENTKGSALMREVHLGFTFDTTAVKAKLRHNCFLPPFQMVFRSLTPISCQVCWIIQIIHTTFLLSQYGSKSGCVSSAFKNCLILTSNNREFSFPTILLSYLLLLVNI